MRDLMTATHGVQSAVVVFVFAVCLLFGLLKGLHHVHLFRFRIDLLGGCGVFAPIPCGSLPVFTSVDVRADPSPLQKK